MKPLTSEQVEETITQSHANILAVAQVTREQRVVDLAIVRELRACFTAGQDNGQALVLQRAESLVTGSVATAQDCQMGRSVSAVMRWVAAGNGRMFGGVSRCERLSDGSTWHAHAMRSDADREQSGDAFYGEYFYGSSPAEALAKLATWCEQYPEKRDTLPAPAPELGQ